MTKPIIKWVGGKRQLLEQLTGRLPSMQIKYYHEPFVGGGALYFQIWEHLDEAHLADTNYELTNLYSQIRRNPWEVIEHLKKFKVSKEDYLEIRNLDRLASYPDLASTFRAARFIYLNKLGFNGLYRVNKKGYNNVPYGANSGKFLDEEGLLEAHRALQKAQITTASFHTVPFHFDHQDGKIPDSFVYFDPPYVPLTATSSFTSYTQDGFGHQQQIELRDVCVKLNKIGVKWMLSNSSAELVYDLYKDFVIEEVDARRSVNCDGGKRGKIKEVIIRNYKD